MALAPQTDSSKESEETIDSSKPLESNTINEQSPSTPQVEPATQPKARPESEPTAEITAATAADAAAAADAAVATATATGAQSKKVLVVSPAWLGDIIMSQSLLKVIKAKDPNAQITVYAPAYANCILERMPEVDAIEENPFAHGEFNFKKRFAEGRRLSAMHFDECYVLPNSLKSAFVPFFAGIKKRIGLKGESRYVLLNKMRSDKNAFARMVNRYVALAYVDDKSVKGDASLPPFAYPQLKLNSPAMGLLTDISLQYKNMQKPFLCLGCGANYGPAKLWPVEHFALVSLHFLQKGWGVLALGSNKDNETIENIKAHLLTLLNATTDISDPVSVERSRELASCFYNVAGKTNLTEALDLVGICSAAVCNDSGMMHTVAAASIPQVCIFGSTSTQYTPPLSNKAICLESTQPCHPCFQRTCKFGTYLCLKELSPESAIQNLEQLLEVYPPVNASDKALHPE